MQLSAVVRSQPGETITISAQPKRCSLVPAFAIMLRMTLSRKGAGDFLVELLGEDPDCRFRSALVGEAVNMTKPGWHR